MVIALNIWNGVFSLRCTYTFQEFDRDRQPAQVLHQSIENNEHWERAYEAEALEPEMSTNTN